MAHDHNVYMILADAAAQRGDEGALRKYAPQLEELAARDKHGLYHAIAHRAWGVAHNLAGEYDLAEERLGQALELFTELKANWQIGRTHFALAELALAKSNQEGAKEHFEYALEAFEVLGAAPDAERTRLVMEASR